MRYPILKNDETGHIIEISKSPFYVGRSLKSDLVLDNQIISRRHCELICRYEGWSLTDYSVNGTSVNDGHYKNKTSPILKNYDEIDLGGEHSYKYQFLIEVNNLADIAVERFRRQECNGLPVSNNLESSPSDEVLNNLAVGFSTTCRVEYEGQIKGKGGLSY